MKKKYVGVQLYATQGGGTAVREGKNYFFHDTPDWSDYKRGDPVPEEWSVHGIYLTYTLLPKEAKKTESRNYREKTFTERNDHFNRRRKVTRKKRKGARLAAKGTLRSITRPRIDAIFHWVGIDMARDERRQARKEGKPVHFLKGDTLKAVNIEDCEEGLRLGDICVMQDRTSETRPFIIVKLQRNGKLKQLEKTRFILHKRYIENE
jgi:hypothetical protein